MNIRKQSFLLILFLCGCMMAGCATYQQEQIRQPIRQEEDLTVKSTYTAPMADSADESIIVNIDTDEFKIRFYNLTLGKTYTLTYDNATGMKNRYGDELVAGQLAAGDMVGITFIKDKKLLKSLQILPDISVTSNVHEFEINSVARTMQFAGEQYKISSTAMVLSKGELLDLTEINAADTLKVTAKDHEVKGILVEKGHGYVRLTGHENFIDGFVEIGQAIIKKVADEMLIVVPEGTYTFYISKNGISGTDEITVNAGEETVVDVSQYQVSEEKKTGKIIFTVTPAKAKLFVDGKETKYEEPVEMTCGIHQIKLKADGYKTLTQYIKVGQSTANFNVELEKSDGKDEDEDEDRDDKIHTSVSGNTISVTGTSDYRVYIDAPANAELYVDGVYVGVVPTNFAKRKGTFVVSLRKDGYQNRSYTLQVDDAEKDVRFSFSELIKKGN